MGRARKEYESLLEEKSEVIRSLHLKMQEGHAGVTAEVPREEELLALSEELERERAQLKEDEETLDDRCARWRCRCLATVPKSLGSARKSSACKTKSSTSWRWLPAIKHFAIGWPAVQAARDCQSAWHSTANRIDRRGRPGFNSLCSHACASKAGYSAVSSAEEKRGRARLLLTFRSSKFQTPRKPGRNKTQNRAWQRFDVSLDRLALRATLVLGLTAIIFAAVVGVSRCVQASLCSLRQTPTGRSTNAYSFPSCCSCVSGLVHGCMVPANGQETPAKATRKLVVSGSATLFVKPDMASITFLVTSTEGSVQNARDVNDKQVKKIKDGLAALKFTMLDIQVIPAGIATVRSDPGNLGVPVVPPTLNRQAQSTFRVTVREKNDDKLRDMVETGRRGGGEWGH